MKRILLYSPDVIGHPRVYCRVIADALAGSPCELVIAMGFSDGARLEDCPDLLPLLIRGGVQLIDTRFCSASHSPHLTAEELVTLQSRYSVDVTLFIEADKFKAQFIRLAEGNAPRLRNRNLGIFANTAEWYPGEDSFTGQLRTLRAPTLRTTLGNIKRTILDRRETAKYFYEQTILKACVLDEIFVKDERLASWRGAPVHWMPEISRPFQSEETPAETSLFSINQLGIERFIASNKDREPVLYFGDAAYYKGYDLFLKFAASMSSICAIHAGRSIDFRENDTFHSDVQPLRERLISEGRLYETNAYVHTQRLKELFFKSVRVYITTHRLALSSSTVIQALEFGRPVLVPARGLLGYRVRQNNLGEVYEYKDLSDLQKKATVLWQSNLSRFTPSINRFWNQFSDEAIRQFFIKRLVGA